MYIVNNKNGFYKKNEFNDKIILSMVYNIIFLDRYREK